MPQIEMYSNWEGRITSFPGLLLVCLVGVASPPMADWRRVHFYNYPRHPQSPSNDKTGQSSCWTDNAHVERFQRTLRDQFLNWRCPEPVEGCEDDPAHTASFNLSLAKWLLAPSPKRLWRVGDWYNTEKPHCSADFAIVAYSYDG